MDTLVEGIGLNRLTWNFKQAEPYIDEAIRVTDEQALKMAKFICVNDGLFWGSSAAINCVAAVKTALKYGPGQKSWLLLVIQVLDIYLNSGKKPHLYQTI